jgi:hypothetical protein
MQVGMWGEIPPSFTTHTKNTTHTMHACIALTGGKKMAFLLINESNLSAVSENDVRLGGEEVNSPSQQFTVSWYRCKLSKEMYNTPTDPTVTDHASSPPPSTSFPKTSLYLVMCKRNVSYHIILNYK